MSTQKHISFYSKTYIFQNPARTNAVNNPLCTGCGIITNTILLKWIRLTVSWWLRLIDTFFNFSYFLRDLTINKNGKWLTNHEIDEWVLGPKTRSSRQFMFIVSKTMNASMWTRPETNDDFFQSLRIFLHKHKIKLHVQHI